MSQATRSLALATSLIALALCGCGGGGGDQSASSTESATEATTETQATAPTAEQAKQGEKQERSFAQGTEEGKGTEEKQRSKPKPPHIKVTLPPISSAPVQGSKKAAPGVKTAKGADNSVQAYGVESSQDAREAAALALQSYLDARLEEDWGRACSALSQKPKEALEKLPAQGQGTEASSCPEAMAALSEGASPAELKEGAQIAEVLSFRVQGDVPTDPSFLLFLGPPRSTLYSMPMYLEGGQWKVGLVIPSALPV